MAERDALAEPVLSRTKDRWGRAAPNAVGRLLWREAEGAGDGECEAAGEGEIAAGREEPIPPFVNPEKEVEDWDFDAPSPSPPNFGLSSCSSSSSSSSRTRGDGGRE